MIVTYPGEIRVAGLNVKVHEVEDDSMGEVSEIAFIHVDSLSGIDQL